MTDAATCPGRAEELSSLLDGELDVAAETSLRRHVNDCPTCRQLFALFREVDDHLPSQDSPPDGLADEIVARLRGEGVVGFRRSRQNWAPLVAVAAMLVLTASVVIHLVRQEAPVTEELSEVTESAPVHGLADSVLPSGKDDLRGSDADEDRAAVLEGELQMDPAANGRPAPIASEGVPIVREPSKHEPALERAEVKRQAAEPTVPAPSTEGAGRAAKEPSAVASPRSPEMETFTQDVAAESAPLSPPERRQKSKLVGAIRDAPAAGWLGPGHAGELDGPWQERLRRFRGGEVQLRVRLDSEDRVRGVEVVSGDHERGVILREFLLSTDLPLTRPQAVVPGEPFEGVLLVSAFP